MGLQETLGLGGCSCLGRPGFLLGRAKWDSDPSFSLRLLKGRSLQPELKERLGSHTIACWYRNQDTRRCFQSPQSLRPELATGQEVREDRRGGVPGSPALLHPLDLQEAGEQIGRLGTCLLSAWGPGRVPLTL